MAKVISQETFDDVVKENIIEFEMDPKEAKDETIKQFEAQGINLGNIIQNLDINKETGEPILNEIIEVIKKHSEGITTIDDETLIKSVETLISECKKSVPHRLLAAKLESHIHALNLIDKELLKETPNEEILDKLVKLSIALTDRHPDIFDDHSMAVITKLIERPGKEEIKKGCLIWIQKSCLMHENNRQNIMKTDCLKLVRPLFLGDDPELVKEVCIVFRHLILDDDIRVPFGKAHDHARTISTEYLADLTKLLKKFSTDKHLSCEIMLSVASLTVRNEFCLVVEEAGGLESIFEIMANFADEMRVLREALKLIKALAGNDTVKTNIMQKGAAPLIEGSLNTYKNNETFAKIALACISTLTLRIKENSKALFETGISETIIETMKIHPKNKDIQRNGAWAIRNMVSRSRDQCDVFINLGAEEVLNDALKEHPLIAQDIKSALRDLGCKVTLIEEWTGTSAIKITNDF